MLFKNTISPFIVFAEIRNFDYASRTHSDSPHLNNSSKLRYIKKSQVSPRLEKYFQAGGPSRPGSWRAPPHLPHSSGPRSPDIGCGHSSYRLERGREGNPRSGRSQHVLQKRTLVTWKIMTGEWSRLNNAILSLNWTCTQNKPWHFSHCCFMQQQKAWHTDE